MKHESSGERLALPFAAIEVSEVQFSPLNEIQKYQVIIDDLKLAGLYGPGLLFCGFDGTMLDQTGTFGDRRLTAGVDEAVFLRAAMEQEAYHDRSTNNPLSYALGKDSDLPALAVYDKTAFTPAPGEPSFDVRTWQLAGGTMDAATRAVFFFRPD